MSLPETTSRVGQGVGQGMGGQSKTLSGFEGLRKNERNEMLVTDNQLSYTMDMNEIIFEVTQEVEGGFVAECLTESIFTQGDTWNELRSNVQDAVNGHFFDRQKPGNIRLHLVRDEVLAAG